MTEIELSIEKESHDDKDAPIFGVLKTKPQVTRQHQCAWLWYSQGYKKQYLLNKLIDIDR